MILQRVGIESLFTLIAVVSIVLAAATIWLFVTNPVTVATAVSEAKSRRSCAASRSPVLGAERILKCL